MPTHRDDTHAGRSAKGNKSLQSTPQLKRPAPQADKGSADTSSNEDGHLGATEEQVSETPAPAGDAFEDEPKQG